jgi:UDP-N-acetyl-2-amino-2-deoxyglucuronate dehydrogenase
MQTPIRFGIIGAGMIAKYHAQAIANTEGAELVALCREDANKAAEAAAAFGVPCETSVDALLARPDIDAICICTPSGQHAEQTLAALKAGKHVLVEKPMALSVADADAMIALSKEKNLALGIALQRRTAPEFKKVRSAIDQGALGKITLGSISIPYLRTQAYYDSAAWRGTWALDGGGVLMNQGIHLLDILLWYMGDPIEVHAYTNTQRYNIEVEDTLSASLRFANGALASIIATTTAEPGFPHRVEVYGEKGGVQIEGENIARWDVPAMPLDQAISSSPSSAGAGASPSGIGTEGHTRLVGDLVQAIREQRQPIVDGLEGRRALAVALAIYQSARTGQAVQLG